MTASDPSPPRAPPRVDRYEVELTLGQGSVGRTLLARDPRIGRRVALKVLRDDLALEPDRRAALADHVRQRVRTAGAFAHPALVVLHDLGDDGAVGPYFVFELLEGQTLREALSRGPLARGDVARLARALGPALAACHTAGIAHGNVKPDNVVFAPSGPRLSGAGFGPFPDLLPSLPEAPAHVAPELLEGRAPSAAADQFSLAATLYEALTGRSPFEGDGEADGGPASLVDAVLRGKHAAPTSLVPELRACPHIDTIFDRALAKDPFRRFTACDAFTSALAASLETAQPRIETPISQGSVNSQLSIVPRATRRWQNAAAATGVLVIFALVLLGRDPHGSGVSLKSVAGAFAMTLAAGPRAAPPRPRPAPPPSPAAALPSGSAAQAGGTAHPVPVVDAGVESGGDLPAP